MVGCTVCYDLRLLLVIEKRSLAIHDVLIRSLHLSPNHLVLGLDSFYEKICFRPSPLLRHVLILRRRDHFASDPARLRELLLLDVEDKIVVEAPEAATLRSA